MSPELADHWLARHGAAGAFAVAVERAIAAGTLALGRGRDVLPSEAHAVAAACRAAAELLLAAEEVTEPAGAGEAAGTGAAR
jgi:hypothetical protein